MATVSTLDFKLGVRMLRRHPGLSLIGGLALAVAITIGVLAFELVRRQLSPSLPLDQGDRVVRLENFDRLVGAPAPRLLYDFQVWRNELKTIEQLGAARTTDRNLILPERPPLPVPVAEMTPSGFGLTRIPPLHGRSLIDADAAPGAPDVVVIGYDLWRQQLGGDPKVVGKAVQLGDSRPTVVGIMPQGFGFPRFQQAWLPLREVARAPGDGPPVLVFGRLATDATLERASTELQLVNSRLSRLDSASRAHVQPRVVPFANVVLPVQTSIVMLAMFTGVFLVLAGISANVATLMFARTALRESEIVIRTALGATRARVVAQLLVESFVLSGVATVAGLLLARAILQFIWYQQVVVGQEPQPFWRSPGLSAVTVLWAVGLAFVAAVLVGLLPALKATNKKVTAAITRSQGDHSAMRFGGVWSFVIVAQVAFSVLCLPIAIGTTEEALRDSKLTPAFSPRDYLTFEAQFDESGGPRLEAAYAELDRKLLSEPSVIAVTHATPGAGYRSRRVEARRGNEKPFIVEGQSDGYVLSSSVDLSFFDVFTLPIVSGRAFDATDPGTPRVILNENLAKRLGGNPIGMQLRDVAKRGDGGIEGTPGPWLEVVGVVKNTGLDVSDLVYEAARPADLNPAHFGVRLRGNSDNLRARLPTLALEADPALRVYRALPLDEVLRKGALPGRMAYVGVLSAISLAVALSAAGLFALMSVAVKRRTREIGIRVALGASSRNVLRALFARAAAQLVGGIVLGNALVFVVRSQLGGPLDPGSLALSMLAISTLMVLVGMAACAVPARRALRVEPTEAIRYVG